MQVKADECDSGNEEPRDSQQDCVLPRAEERPPFECYVQHGDDTDISTESSSSSSNVTFLANPPTNEVKDKDIATTSSSHNEAFRSSANSVSAPSTSTQALNADAALDEEAQAIALPNIPVLSSVRNWPEHSSVEALNNNFDNSEIVSPRLPSDTLASTVRNDSSSDSEPEENKNSHDMSISSKLRRRNNGRSKSYNCRKSMKSKDESALENSHWEFGERDINFDSILSNHSFVREVSERTGVGIESSTLRDKLLKDMKASLQKARYTTCLYDLDDPIYPSNRPCGHHFELEERLCLLTNHRRYADTEPPKGADKRLPPEGECLFQYDDIDLEGYVLFRAVLTEPYCDY